MAIPTLNRRAALGLSAGAATLAVAGGALWLADAAGRPLADGDAYAPWRLWNDPQLAGTPLALVAAAALAANPHDTQPWLFRIRDSEIEVRRRPDAPSRRDGRLRARAAPRARLRDREHGARRSRRTALPRRSRSIDGSLLALAERDRPVVAARLALTRRAAEPGDPLYGAIPNRHTNRYAYDRAAPLPADWLALARGDSGDDSVRVLLFGDGAERRAFDAAVVAATEAIIADAPMIADSDRWFRDSPAEIDAHRDGPTLEAAGLSPIALGLARLLPVSAQTSHSAWLAATRDVQLASAPLTGLIAVRDRYDRRGAIAAGRLWQRLHLAATVAGVAMQPLNQPLEMIDRERSTSRGDVWARRLAALTGPDWQATFAFRAGAPTHAAPPSPRRRLVEIVA